MISKAMIKLQSKFQFQILLQFCKIAEKVAKIKLKMAVVKSFDFDFGYYFDFS